MSDRLKLNNKYFLRFASFALLVCLTACATLSEDECRQAAWHDIGLKDGGKGERFDILNDHAKSCDKYGIMVDANAYRTGYEQGLKSYCTFENGILVGGRGDYYQDVCQGEAEYAFLSAYKPNKHLYDLKEDKGYLESNIANLKQRILDGGSSADEIEKAKQQLIADEDELVRVEKSLVVAERNIKVVTIDYKIKMLKANLANHSMGSGAYRSTQSEIDQLILARNELLGISAYEKGAGSQRDVLDWVIDLLDLIPD